MVAWEDIHAIMLDMDGTLLDLNFDAHFWLEHVPRRYAELHGHDVDSAKEDLYPRLHSMKGTMQWYCIDYWSRELGMDIAALKEEVDHLIEVRPHASEFVDALTAAGKRVLLVTNAHAKSLSLKMKRTGLADRFHAIVCSHDFGMPKEHAAFWKHLQESQHFDPEHTLLIDDSLPVLRSARAFGIAHLLAVHRPNSKAPPVDVQEFEAVRSFEDILPQRRLHPAAQAPST